MTSSAWADAVGDARERPERRRRIVKTDVNVARIDRRYAQEGRQVNYRNRHKAVSPRTDGLSFVGVRLLVGEGPNAARFLVGEGPNAATFLVGESPNGVILFVGAEPNHSSHHYANHVIRYTVVCSGKKGSASIDHASSAFSDWFDFNTVRALSLIHI